MSGPRAAADCAAVAAARGPAAARREPRRRGPGHQGAQGRARRSQQVLRGGDTTISNLLNLCVKIPE